jgi:hypothetical protein
LATLVVVLVPLLVLALLATQIERPFWRFSPIPGRERRAAVALRDAVSPFEQWGSQAFTLPYLERYYDRAYYITEIPGMDPREAFVSSVRAALAQYEAVDIWLLAHSNEYIDWVATIEPALRHRIRLVYNTGCYDEAQAAAWLRIGAAAYVGHPGESWSPVFYVYFLRRWSLGTSLELVVSDSNAQMSRTLGWMGRLPGIVAGPQELCEESRASCYGQCDITIEDSP